MEVGKKLAKQVSKFVSKPVLIIDARFYDDIADQMVESAIAELDAANIPWEKYSVPGVFEIPAAIKFSMRSERFSGWIALGCVIRGETTHYDYVCEESARGISNLAVGFGLPIGYGIITAENRDQANVRADRSQKDVGGRAAKAAIAMIKMKKDFPAPAKSKNTK